MWTGVLAVAGMAMCGGGVYALCGGAWAAIYAGIAMLAVSVLTGLGARHEP